MLFSTTPESVSVSAEYEDGSPISGTASIDGDAVRWVPDEPLARGARVVVTFDSCDRETRTSFEVVGEGTAPDELLGATWELDLSQVDIVRPAGLSEELTPGDLVFRWLVVDEDAEGFDVLVSDSVRSCSTIVANERDGDLFEADVSGLEFGAGKVSGGQVRGILGEFDLVGIEAEILWDLRDTAGGCDLIRSVGQECEPCADGELGCLGFFVTATEVDLVIGHVHDPC